jgi:diadenosine tetraphosphate (Ap4A) HIT family hydrolase
MSEKKPCGICAGITSIKEGKLPDFIAELPHSYAILGDAQFYRGYCILFAKTHATELYLMPREEALALFDEVRSTAEAIAAVTHPHKLNYECLGNTEPHVHWHLLPRYEDDDLRLGPIWIRPEAERKRQLDEHDRRALMASLRAEIVKRIPDARIPGD